MTQGAGDGSDEGACVDCSQSPGVLSPGAEATKPAKKGRPAKDAAPQASKSKASKKPQSAAEPERSSARSRQPPPFLKAPNFKVPSKAKAPKKKTAKINRSKEDVAKIAQHSLVAPGIPVHGYVYDCKTGKINHIVSAVT